MLNILQKSNLVNVLAIVTRYFGGILLGTGGLVRSYSESIQSAIEKSHKIQKYDGIEMHVTMDYSGYSNFKYYCKSNNIFLTNVEYSEFIVVTIDLEENKKEKLLKDFEAKTIILKDIKEIGKKYITKNMENKLVL